MERIEFRVLGTLDLKSGGKEDFGPLLAQPKRVALLVYLCLQKPRGLHRRDTLVALFWPDSDQAHARNSLRNSIHALRRGIGEDAFELRGDEEIGVRESILWCDAIAFEDLARASRVDEAIELYRGDLLPGFFVDAAPPFERWLEDQRHRLRMLAAKAARAAAQRREAENRVTDAISSAQRAVQLSSSDERIVRGLIELLLRAGDRSEAVRVYEEFARHLASEFQTVPAKETTALLYSSRAPG